MVELEAEDGPRKYLILGLPLNTEYATGPDGQKPPTMAAGLKRELSPIVEGADDGDEEESRQVKRVKVEETPVTAQEPPIASSISAEPGAAEMNTNVQNGEEEASKANVTSSTSSTCKLPPVHPLVAHLLSLPNPLASTTPSPNNPDNEQRPAYRIDVYLDEGANEDEDPADPLGAAFNEDRQSQGFRKAICRCPSCLEAFKDLPFLLAEEETYSPPASQSGLPAGVPAGDGEQDDDARSASSHSSTYDLGLDALNRLPRAQTLEAMEGYGRLRAALFEHLRPFAQSGKTVDEESIRRFFEEQRARDREGR
jgi:E3 ubiquitin-protein ligase UBR7